MRIPCLLVSLVFGTVSLGAAPSNSTVEMNPISDSHPAVERHHFDLHNLGSIHIVDDRDKVCYTMRSYVVAQEDRDSDSIRLVGYSTCQPSSKYDLKITADPDR